MCFSVNIFRRCKVVYVESIFKVVWKDEDGEWDHRAIIITIISKKSEFTPLLISLSKHGTKVSSVQKQRTSQRRPYNFVRLSWDYNWASQRILFASQWQFPKDSRDHARVIRSKENSFWRSSLNELFNGWSLVCLSCFFFNCFA